MTPTGARFPHGGLDFDDDKGVNLEDLTAELLAEPPDQFTSKRNGRVKELKAAGQRDLAAQLSDIKKPALPLWAANQVRRDDPAALRNLQESSQGLAKAQQATGRGRADAARDLRSASEEFQRNLEAATTVAAEALRRRGHPPTEEALRHIREMMRLAVTQRGEAWDRLVKGALTSEPEPADDLVAMFRAGTAAASAKPTKADEQAEARRAQELAERAAQADLERAQQLEAAAKRLRNEAREAAAAAERAEQRASAAEAEAAAARAQAQKSQRAIARRRS